MTTASTTIGGPDSLLAGIGRADITPPLGMRLNGTLREGTAHRVEGPLQVTALALRTGSMTIVIVTADMIIVSPAEAAKLRADVGARVDCPIEHVYFNISHTHAAPSPPSWADHDPETEAEGLSLNRAYHELAVAQAVSAAEEAVATLRPARLSVGRGEVRIGVNRREELPDGTMVLGENPDGITDPTVGVVRVDGLDGSPLAVLVHHACHPDVLGPKSDLLSPDYVGTARSVLEQVTGAAALFLQGCAGDIDPRCGIVVGDDGAVEAARLGAELACEAGRVYQSLASARTRDERVVWSSAASKVTGWVYRDVPAPPTELAAAEVTLRLPLRELPSLDEAEAQVKEAASGLAHLESRPHRLSELLTARRRVLFAQLQLEAVLDERIPEVDLTLNAVRLGPVALLGIPAEVFVEIGLQISARSPFETTLVSGYTNGVLFYIPTAKAHAQGGYEVNSHKNYLVFSGPTPAWEDEIVNASVSLLEQLSSGLSPELEEVSP